MIHETNARAPRPSDGDPQRLHQSGTEAATLLREYAQRTRPAMAGGAGAWYRLRTRLDGGPTGDGAWSALRRRAPGARLLTRVLTAAVALVVLARWIPSRRVHESFQPGASPIGERHGGRRAAGGGAGTSPRGAMGAGGMEGASGARDGDDGETASAGQTSGCSPRIG